MVTGYPHRTPDGKPVTACLDWSGRDGVRHFGGQLRPCRSCGHLTLLLDADGRPQHKACAEYEHEAALRGRGPASANPGGQDDQARPQDRPALVPLRLAS